MVDARDSGYSCSLHASLEVVQQIIRDFPQLPSGVGVDGGFERLGLYTGQPGQGLFRLRLMPCAIFKEGALIRIEAVRSGAKLRFLFLSGGRLGLGDPLADFGSLERVSFVRSCSTSRPW